MYVRKLYIINVECASNHDRCCLWRLYSNKFVIRHCKMNIENTGKQSVRYRRPGRLESEIVLRFSSSGRPQWGTSRKQTKISRSNRLCRIFRRVIVADELKAFQWICRVIASASGSIRVYRNIFVVHHLYKLRANLIPTFITEENEETSIYYMFIHILVCTNCSMILVDINILGLEYDYALKSSSKVYSIFTI